MNVCNIGCIDGIGSLIGNVPFADGLQTAFPHSHCPCSTCCPHSIAQQAINLTLFETIYNNRQSRKKENPIIAKTWNKSNINKWMEMYK
jgi:hypothetical protein